MSSNEFNTALTPVMQSHFDQIIKPKDRNDGVTEGELFAGVAYHAIIEQSGTAAGREYLKLVNQEREKGAGLFTAAKAALNKMGKIFAKTKFKSKKDAAKLGENLEREIRKTASACAQLDGKAGVSNRKESAKDLTEAYQTAAGAYDGRKNELQEGSGLDQEKQDIDSDGGSGGDVAGEVPGVTPRALERYSGLFDAMRETDKSYRDTLDAYKAEKDPDKRAEIGFKLQELASMRKEIRELLSSLIKADNETAMAVVRNIR